jgi:poly-gamma-glutamate capsule biosynthesis protein CapA/YwtB (metallophosphatase superfamily)
MTTPSNSRGPRRASRPLVVVVIALWVVAAAVAGYAVWNSLAGAGAATLPTADSAAIAPSGDLLPTLPPTTTEATTTTTLAPALTVAAGGDVHGDRKVGKFIDANGGAAVFAGVKPYLEEPDLAFVNLEGPISDQGNRRHKEFTFRSRPALLDGLVSAGIDIVSLANNHTLDYGWNALSDCISRLDVAGVAHAGAGVDAAAAAAPAMLQTPAGTVAFIAVSEISASFAAGSHPGTYYTSGSNDGLLANVAAAAQQADFVIVSLHWGKEYHPEVTAHQVSLGHRLIDAGADLVLGHHPHVIEGLELYKDRLIVYSMGDFVFDHYSRATGEAFVLQVTLPRDGPPWGTITPVYLTDSHGIPGVVTGSEANSILRRLTSLSAARGLQLNREGDIATFGSPAPAPDTVTSTTTGLVSPTTTLAP